MLLNTAGVAGRHPEISGGEVVLVLIVQLALWLLGLGGNGNARQAGAAGHSGTVAQYAGIAVGRGG